MGVLLLATVKGLVHQVYTILIFFLFLFGAGVSSSYHVYIASQSHTDNDRYNL